MDITIRPAKNANELGPAWQNIAGNRHIYGQKENRFKIIQIQKAIAGEIKQPKTLISVIEELYFSKEVKESALESEGKSCHKQ